MTVLMFTRHVTGKQLKMLSQETVHRNWIDFATKEKVLNSYQMLNYSDILFIHLFIYLFIYFKS